MEQIIKLEQDGDNPDIIIAGVTDVQNYLSARTEAEEFAEKTGLDISTIPQAIDALANNQEIRSAVRPRWIDTNSIELQGQIDSSNAYQVSHGIGQLSRLEGIRKGFDNMSRFGFMPSDLVTDEDLLIHFEDLRKGNVPSAKKPYVVTLNVPEGYEFIPISTNDKEVYAMRKAGKLIIYESGQLRFDQAKMDDRFLAGVGSPDGVEKAIKIVKDEGYDSIGSYHRIKEVGFKKSRGRPLFLNGYKYGLIGYDYIANNGRFLVVGDGVAQRSAEGTSQKLEDKLTISLGQNSFVLEGTTYFKTSLADGRAIYLPQITQK